MHTYAYNKEKKMDIFNIETGRPEEFNEKDGETKRKEDRDWGRAGNDKS